MPVLYLTWPPSQNALWRAFRGRTILSKVGREWYAYASEQLENAPKVKGPVHILVELRPPNKRRFDPDNKVKPLFDALVKSGIIEDDTYTIIPRFEVSVSEPQGENGFVGARITITPL